MLPKVSFLNAILKNDNSYLYPYNAFVVVPDIETREHQGWKLTNGATPDGKEDPYLKFDFLQYILGKTGATFKPHRSYGSRLELIGDSSTIVFDWN